LQENAFDSTKSSPNIVILPNLSTCFLYNIVIELFSSIYSIPGLSSSLDLVAKKTIKKIIAANKIIIININISNNISLLEQILSILLFFLFFNNPNLDSSLYSLIKISIGFLI